MRFGCFGWTEGLALTGILAIGGRLHIKGVGCAEAVEGPVRAVELSGQGFAGVVGEDDGICACAGMEGRNWDYRVSLMKREQH